MANQKPENVIRHGNVKAAIWKNEGKDGQFFTATFTRVYRDGENLRDTRSGSSRDRKRNH